jgi:transposase
MQGKKHFQEKLFVSFQLSNAVPADNIYRRLKDLIDFSFMYKSTAEYYGGEGQKSIDPVVFMKLMLVGYLENLNSDRRIISISKMRMDILFFLGYDLDEELPWHSTLSRTRQLYGQEVFSEMFKLVLKQCIDNGMVSGRRQAVDGVYVKANASLDSMIEREILDDAVAFGEELDANQQEDVAKVIAIDKLKHKDYNNLPLKKNPGNKTHYSPSDPDAKMSVKPGKATALNFLSQVCVDTASHMITHIEAFSADKRDCQCLEEVVQKVKHTLSSHGIMLEEVIADAGYSSGEALRALEKNKIQGYIPNRGQYIHERPDFPYSADGDFYTCPNNKKLTYRGSQKDGNYINKHYRTSIKNCHSCPFRNNCSALKTQGPLIKQTEDSPYYERMHYRMLTKKAKILMKKRQSTVEPVIGSLVNNNGMKRINTKGLVQANKCMTMAAVAYNLKKLLRFTIRKVQVNVMAKANLERIVKNSFKTTCLNVSSVIVAVKNHFHFSQSIRELLIQTAN